MPGVGSFLRGQLLQSVPLPTTDLTGRTVLVTGANSGLGLDCAKHLLRLNCSHIVLACRTVEKGEAAKKDILSSASSFSSSITTKSDTKTPVAAAAAAQSTVTISTYALDLTSFASVSDFAAKISREIPRLDSVILNAGVDLTTWSTAEGYETTLTVNVVSTFALALLLLPKLREGRATQLQRQQHDDKSNHVAIQPPRISIVGSAVHFWADTKALTRVPPTADVLRQLSDRAWSVEQGNAPMGGEARYSLSKLLVMMCVVRLAAQITAEAAEMETGPLQQHQQQQQKQPFVLVNNVAPGFCRTALFRNDDKNATKIPLRLIGRPSEVGARCLVHAGCEVGIEGGHGTYLSESRVKEMRRWIGSEEGKEIGERVWGEVLRVVEGMRK